MDGARENGRYDRDSGDAIGMIPEPDKDDHVMYRGGLHKIISDGAFERNGMMFCTLSHADVRAGSQQSGNIERDVPLAELGIKLGCANYSKNETTKTMVM